MLKPLTTLLVLTVLIALVAAIIDWRKGIIPNLLTYGLLVLGPILQLGLLYRGHAAAGLGLLALYTVSGVVLNALVPLLLWRCRVLGGGDVKLLAALGGLLGPSLGLRLQLYAFLTGTVFSLLLLAYRGRVRATARECWALLARVVSRKARSESLAKVQLTEFAFGPAILVASVLLAFAEWP